MTLQKLVFLLKEDGWTDTAVTVAICHYLAERGYHVTDTTYLVIKKHLRLYAQFIQEAA